MPSTPTSKRDCLKSHCNLTIGHPQHETDDGGDCRLQDQQLATAFLRSSRNQPSSIYDATGNDRICWTLPYKQADLWLWRSSFYLGTWTLRDNTQVTEVVSALTGPIKIYIHTATPIGGSLLNQVQHIYRPTWTAQGTYGSHF